MRINIKKLPRAELLDMAAYIFSKRNPYLFRTYCFPMMSALEAAHITKEEINQIAKEACSLVNEKESILRDHTQEQISMMVNFIRTK